MWITLGKSQKKPELAGFFHCKTPEQLMIDKVIGVV